MKIITDSGQEIELTVSKIVQINISDKKEKTTKDFIYFDRLNDGTFRLTYTKGILKENNR